MKRKLAYVLLAVSFTVAPLAFTTGCAVTQGRESAKAYAGDKQLAARIKTALYTDSTVKGTQVEVQVLKGEVQLSGFVDSQQAKDRAGQIANETPGVVAVHNNLLVPTGRQGQSQGQ